MKYIVYGSFAAIIGFIISLVTQGGRDAWSDLIHNSLIELRLNRKLPKEERKSAENRKELFFSFLPTIILLVVIVAAFLFAWYGINHWEEIK